MDHETVMPRTRRRTEDKRRRLHKSGMGREEAQGVVTEGKEEELVRLVGWADWRLDDLLDPRMNQLASDQDWIFARSDGMDGLRGLTARSCCYFIVVAVGYSG